MRRYKIIQDGYITEIGNGFCGIGISESEYNAIKNAINTMPTVPDGYMCKLRNDLTWESMIAPIVEEEPDEEPDMTPEEALRLIMGDDYSLKRSDVTALGENVMLTKQQTQIGGGMIRREQYE